MRWREEYTVREGAGTTAIRAPESFDFGGAEFAPLVLGATM
jgi:hypothetical protein